VRRALLAALFVGAAARAEELPSDPGVLWDPADSLHDEAKARIAGAAEAATRTSGQKILVVTSRPSSLSGDFDAFVARAAAVWSDRTIVFAIRHDWKVRIVPPAAARPMLTDAAVAAFERRLHRRLSDHDFDLSIGNVVHDLGETLAGRPPAPWVEWKHPLFLLSGGQDTRGAPLAMGLSLAFGGAILFLLFLRALWQDPRRVLGQIAIEAGEMVVGGVLGGVGGGGGSSFSGGGGSSGGGGANGSW
jgi:uncharacterized protein